MNSQSGINQQFAFSRWSKLVALHWADNRKRYLLAVPAIFGLLVVWDAFLLVMDRYNPLDDGMQTVTYYTGLIAVGCLYASTIFSAFGSKAQGIAWLSVPASALEKLLCGLLFSVVLFFLVYTVVFFLVDIPMVELCNRLIEREHRVWSAGYPILPDPIYNVLNGMPNAREDNQYHLFLLCYFALQSTCVLGSVYFSRYAFIKTAVAVLIFILFFMCLEARVIEPLLPDGYHRHPMLDWMKDQDTLGVKVIRLSPLISAPLGFLLLYGTPFVFWIATYFRLKEKEV
jgi:hypothetical protein